jgi:hypothetical protein
MVQALQDGRKTMTRRLVKPQPESIDFYPDRNVWYPEVSKCPYEVGDVLWVRETFYKTEAEELNGAFFYKADIDKLGWTFKWKPSLFMPKEACRIFLRIKSIKVERLQDISEEDIKKEGVQMPVSHRGNTLFVLGKDNSALSFLGNNTKSWTAYDVWKAHWAELWCKINGRTSWDSNPYVFAYEFEHIEKPLDFIL